MAYFEWADDMVIDGGPIDDDHKLLVDLVNELHTATSQGAGQSVIESVLARAISSTREHLSREEAVMARMGFPHLDRDKEGHDAFMNQLLGLQQRLQDGGITVAAQLSTALRDWLSLHIRRNDKELRKFERQRIRERERDQAAARRASRTAAPRRLT